MEAEPVADGKSESGRRRGLERVMTKSIMLLGLALSFAALAGCSSQATRPCPVASQAQHQPPQRFVPARNPHLALDTQTWRFCNPMQTEFPNDANIHVPSCSDLSRNPDLSLAASASAESGEPRQTGENGPTMKQCEVWSREVDNNFLALRNRSADDINELDWKLSVCVGNFIPVAPRGLTLILDAHGNVADEFRNRIEKAIETLPMEEQAKVWHAFHADSGEAVTPSSQ
jgi:hypothetical protein